MRSTLVAIPAIIVLSLSCGCGDGDGPRTAGNGSTEQTSRNRSPSQPEPPHTPSITATQLDDQSITTKPESKPDDEAQEIRPPRVVRDTSRPELGGVRYYYGGTVIGRIGDECGIPVFLYVQGGTLYVGDKRLGDRIQVSLEFHAKVGDRAVTDEDKKAARQRISDKLREQPARLTDVDGKQVGEPSAAMTIDSGIATIKQPARLVTPWGEIELILPKATNK